MEALQLGPTLDLAQELAQGPAAVEQQLAHRTDALPKFDERFRLRASVPRDDGSCVVIYTGTKYTQQQAEAIWAEAQMTALNARARLLKIPQPADENAPLLEGPQFRTKTIANARVSAPVARVRVPTPASGPPRMELDADLEEHRFLLELLAEVVATLQREQETALDRRDREIEALRCELKELRAEARRQAPSDSELSNLRATVAKQEKLIAQLRGRMSSVEFGQRDLAKTQRKARHETMTELTVFGQQTRRVMEDLIGEPISQWPS
jgi:hypothetical protein